MLIRNLIGKQPIGPDRGMSYIGPKRQSSPTKETQNMKSSTRDKAEGTAKIVAGGAKQTAGKVVNSDRLQGKGIVQKAEGRTQKQVGEIKQVVGK